MSQPHSTATLTDRDLDEIEAQMDETSPIYLPALLRELRKAREATRNLLILARVVDAHFRDTDAPLGRAARHAVEIGERASRPSAVLGTMDSVGPLVVAPGRPAAKGGR